METIKNFFNTAAEDGLVEAGKQLYDKGAEWINEQLQDWDLSRVFSLAGGEQELTTAPAPVKSNFTLG